MVKEALFNDFIKLDIRVGTVKSALVFPEARNPSYKLEIDFGEPLGTKKSSAQITARYHTDELIGKQVLAVVNLPPASDWSFYVRSSNSWRI